ncbi:MAG: hypothetical protein FD144_5797 [Rhodospirillaceae bacterium]|nr:MAG: hypothetical protein FD144_5797 [Rhodospirillaceae bacterium]
MIPEDAIRLRSYLIWQATGCPHGKALEHWLQAKDELAGDYVTLLPRLDECERIVMPRLPILRPPQRITASRIPPGERRASPIAARR